MTTSPHAASDRSALALGLVEPMVPTPSPEPTDAPDRLYEIKWEGIRAISVVGDGEVRMHTRGGTDITAAFPEVAEALRAAAGDASVVLDGELVALSDEGIPQRYAVVERWLGGPGARRRTPVNYEVFDILHLDGSPLLNLPLYERKARLHDALRPNATVHVCHFEEGEGVAMYAAARQLGLHGIVAKDKHSLYEPGKRSRHWLSTKNARTMNLVVGGYTFGGSKRPFDSLLLGVFEDGRFRFTGAAGAGTARGDQRLLHEMLSRLHTDRCPFTREPSVSLFSHWCEPSLAVEVEYGERSPDGTFLFLVFNSLRPDINPRDCDALSLAS
ncbi:MAG: hypothetical protein OXL97_15755 [Chloroflexota bacterium]|nr:hypothetical protein [Chloroflexota bacterium]MDE2884581.1 hypothetical protein [Chloroflexota bacterium]